MAAMTTPDGTPLPPANLAPRVPTPQEQLWAGDFGRDYIERNRASSLVEHNKALFAKVLAATGDSVGSAIEFGANIGNNLRALRELLPQDSGSHPVERHYWEGRALEGASEDFISAREAALGLLETVATSFSGVQRAFAIQAGREVRVMVQPDTIDDLASIHLARDVAKKIEESLQYPGQIKVTVIRETRVVDYAR